MEWSDAAGPWKPFKVFRLLHERTVVSLKNFSRVLMWSGLMDALALERPSPRNVLSPVL